MDPRPEGAYVSVSQYPGGPDSTNLYLIEQVAGNGEVNSVSVVPSEARTVVVELTRLLKEAGEDEGV